MQNKNVENEQSAKKDEINPSKKRKLIASFLLGMGLVAGGHNINNHIKDEGRFTDGYRNIPQQQDYVTASHSPETSVPNIAEPVEQPQFDGSYAINQHPVEIQPTNTDQINVKSAEDKNE